MRYYMANYIGADIAKKSLQIYLPITNKSFNITNDHDGFTKLLSTLVQHYDLTSLIIVFEPTGGYEKPFVDFLVSNKINFSVVHPNSKLTLLQIFNCNSSKITIFSSLKFS